MNEAHIHPSAVIDQPCRIGEGTHIWHFCHIMPRALIGPDCVLGQNVFVGEGVVIGKRVKIQNNVSVYSGVTLEDDVFVGPSAVFTNVATPRAALPRRDPEQRSSTLVRAGATIGANATIVCGVTIGRYAFVGAGAVVCADVDDFSLVLGAPARPAGYRCPCGAGLAFEANRATCVECGRQLTLEAGVVTLVA